MVQTLPAIDVGPPPARNRSRHDNLPPPRVIGSGAQDDWQPCRRRQWRSSTFHAGIHMELQSGIPQDSTRRPARAEADSPSLPSHLTEDSPAPPPSAFVEQANRLQRGQVLLDSARLRQLRQGRLMSQQDLANECWRRNIPLSLTTIKRAERGCPVRFRIAREFARCFEVPVAQLLRAEDAVAALAMPGH